MSEVEAATAIVRHMLTPVQGLLDHPDLTDFHINGPGEGKAFVDFGKGMEQITLPYTARDLEDLGIYAAAITRQSVSEVTPLVSTRFPDGERIQILFPPAVHDGRVHFSLRKPHESAATEEDLERGGTFDGTFYGSNYMSETDIELRRLYKAGDGKALIGLAVESGKNIVFSGEVGSGKTFLMNFYLKKISKKARIVTVEDVPELLGMPQPNVVNTFYSAGNQSIAKITAEKLVANAMRLGMDWLLNQELRDEAAYAYLDVLDSGHKAMTTVHAETAKSTRMRIRNLAMKHPSGMNMDPTQLMASLQRGIDMVVHCRKEKDSRTGKWRRFIDEILYDPDEKEKYDHIPSPFNHKETA